MSIRVSPQQLRDIANGLNRGSSDVQTELDALRKTVAPLEGQFTGDAAAAFEDLFQRWLRSGDELRRSLEGLSHLLGDVARVFEDTDRSAAGSMRT
jgi:WXG100 family type VII secretion target